MIHQSSISEQKAKIEKNGKKVPNCVVGSDVQGKDGVESMSKLHIE
jgi:acyl-[acyl carrier protein]--UDP-N-acetylglucosamine O-acyltransferase